MLLEIHTGIFEDAMIGSLGFTSESSWVQMEEGLEDQSLSTVDSCQSWVMGMLEYDILFSLLIGINLKYTMVF